MIFDRGVIPDASIARVRGKKVAWTWKGQDGWYFQTENMQKEGIFQRGPYKTQGEAELAAERVWRTR